MATAFLDAPRPLAFAHRGGAAHAPENSWRAFEHAVSLGYRYLETDLQATAPLPEVLRRTNAWDRVCVVSFSASRLRATRRALGRPVCMAASPFGTAVVRLGGPRGRHDPQGPGRLRSRPRQSPGLLMEYLARTGVRCVQVPISVATPSFIGRAQAMGLQVHVWTINERPIMERLLDLGVDGIMTDETVALREVLSARSLWHP